MNLESDIRPHRPASVDAQTPEGMVDLREISADFGYLIDVSPYDSATIICRFGQIYADGDMLVASLNGWHDSPNDETDFELRCQALRCVGTPVMDGDFGELSVKFHPARLPIFARILNPLPAAQEPSKSETAETRVIRGLTEAYGARPWPWEKPSTPTEVTCLGCKSSFSPKTCAITSYCSNACRRTRQRASIRIRDLVAELKDTVPLPPIASHVTIVQQLRAADQFLKGQKTYTPEVNAMIRRSVTGCVYLLSQSVAPHDGYRKWVRRNQALLNGRYTVPKNNKAIRRLYHLVISDIEAHHFKRYIPPWELDEWPTGGTRAKLRTCEPCGNTFYGTTKYCSPGCRRLSAPQHADGAE